jgi:hypothetical protein
MVAAEKKDPLAEVEKVPVEIVFDKEPAEKNKDLGYIVVVDKVVVDKKYLENKVAVVELDILAVASADLN